MTSSRLRPWRNWTEYSRSSKRGRGERGRSEPGGHSQVPGGFSWCVPAQAPRVTDHRRRCSEGGALGPSQIPRRARGIPTPARVRTHTPGFPPGSGRVPALRWTAALPPLPSPPHPDPRLNPGVASGAKGRRSRSFCFHTDTNPTSHPDDLEAAGAGTRVHTCAHPATTSLPEPRTDADAPCHVDRGLTCRAQGLSRARARAHAHAHDADPPCRAGLPWLCPEQPGRGRQEAPSARSLSRRLCWRSALPLDTSAGASLVPIDHPACVRAWRLLGREPREQSVPSAV